eukprot:1620512-Rhodomonas_salina.1
MLLPARYLPSRSPKRDRPSPLPPSGPRPRTLVAPYLPPYALPTRSPVLRSCVCCYQAVSVPGTAHSGYAGAACGVWLYRPMSLLRSSHTALRCMAVPAYGPATNIRY